MTLAMSADTIAYYQREADRRARGMQQYGGNAAIVDLRCFKWYHPDSGSWLTAPDGRQRWFGPKTMRIYAILHRLSSGGRMTMGDIASEAMCSTSTVSRAVQRLQAFGFFAIDITRGRNGGITVRRRQIGDALRHYAEDAWARIKRLINVASTHKEGMRGIFSREKELKKVTDSLVVDMDATFNEAWDGAEERTRRLLADKSDAGEAFPPPGRAREGSQDRDQRIRAWVADTIHERVRLDQEDPDWDLELEKVRASYGMDSRWPA